MSTWVEQDLTDKVVEILSSLPGSEHHFGPRFATPYQLAIELMIRWPDTAAALNKPVGGAGTGQQDSLAQYLANELSRRIKHDHDFPVEGALLSGSRLTALEYSAPDGSIVRSSLVGSGFDGSMFRLRA